MATAEHNAGAVASGVKTPARGRRRVAVTGMGVLSASAVGIAAFETALRRGTSGVRRLPDDRRAGFSTELAAVIDDLDPLAHFTRRELRRMDRASQLTLIACAEAMTMAGLGGPRRACPEAGVVLGTTLGGMNSGLAFYRRRATGLVDASLLQDFPPHSANDRVAARWGIRGPSLVLSTACAASTHAIGVAAELIRSGQLETALTAGYDPFSDLTFAGFGVLGLLSQDAVRPFDKDRSGLVLGEGAGVLVLESWDQAHRREAPVLAEICGFGMTSDAFHMTAPEADGQGAARAIRQAVDDAGIAPSDVDYVNAHGTGTRKNDVAEVRALGAALGERARTVPVSSTKSMIGHTLGASGAIELIATILGMNGGFLPPTINYRTPDPECDLDCVPNESRPADIRVALSNSFGFGGNNGCLVVRKCGPE